MFTFGIIFWPPDFFRRLFMRLNRFSFSICFSYSAILFPFLMVYCLLWVRMRGRIWVFCFRYAIISRLVCWRAARGNLEVLSNSGGLSSAELNLDEAEESPPNGAARPKLLPIPILSHPRSNSSGLLRSAAPLHNPLDPKPF